MVYVSDCDITMPASPFILKQNRSCTKFLRVSFSPERTLSVLIFLYFLQGEQHHISPSGDFEDEQGGRNIDSLHPGQDMEILRCFSGIGNLKHSLGRPRVHSFRPVDRRVPCQE